MIEVWICTMNVLGSVRLSTLIHVGAVETLATILICYAVAVTRGHVKPFLPMISGCAVDPPEKYPFRFGLALSSFFIGVQTVAVHLAEGYSKASLYLGLLASLSLGIVSVVNEDENNSVHSSKLSIQFNTGGPIHQKIILCDMSYLYYCI